MQATALHDFLAGRAGATGDDHGIVVARHFGDAAREYAALRERAAVVDLGDRCIVGATGADRVTFLQGMLTNDVARLGPGTGCPALLLTIQGRVVADLLVSADAEALVLDVDRRAEDAMVAALDALIIADDVELAADEATTLVGLAGPDALGLVPAAAALAPYAHVRGDVGGVAVRVVRAGAAAPVAVVLHAPRSEAPRVWESLVAAGAVACGRDALEARRIELGVPRIGIDMGEKTLALELPVEEAVSATKGCYLGQEVIARGTARGHVNRRLCGLVFDGVAPAEGAALTVDGREVGAVTSVAVSPALRRPIGLGFVRREHWDPGATLVVGDGTGHATAVVAAWPLA